MIPTTNCAKTLNGKCVECSNPTFFNSAMTECKEEIIPECQQYNTYGCQICSEGYYVEFDDNRCYSCMEAIVNCTTCHDYKKTETVTCQAVQLIVIYQKIHVYHVMISVSVDNAMG